MNLLEKLRNKSVHERKIAAFTAAGIIVAIIFIVWTSTFLSTMADQQDEQNRETASVIDSQKTTTYDAFIKSVKRVKENIKNLEIFDFSTDPIEYKKESP